MDDRGIRQGPACQRGLAARLYEAAVKRRRGQRGLQKAPIKKAITLRIDPDILARYKATGPGWQSRMNEALRRSLETA